MVSLRKKDSKRISVESSFISPRIPGCITVWLTIGLGSEWPEYYFATPLLFLKKEIEREREEEKRGKKRHSPSHCRGSAKSLKSWSSERSGSVYWTGTTSSSSVRPKKSLWLRSCSTSRSSSTAHHIEGVKPATYHFAISGYTCVCSKECKMWCFFLFFLNRLIVISPISTPGACPKVYCDHFNLKFVIFLALYLWWMSKLCKMKTMKMTVHLQLAEKHRSRHARAVESGGNTDRRFLTFIIFQATLTLFRGHSKTKQLKLKLAWIRGKLSSDQVQIPFYACWIYRLDIALITNTRMCT